MYRKTFVFCLSLILLLFANLSSQPYNKVISITPQWLSSGRNMFPETVNYNPNSIGYIYVLQGVSSQFYRFNVGNPGSWTPLGSALTNVMIVSGDFANPTGVWKFYVENYESPYTIYEVDTSNGTITSVGSPTNLRSGHRPRVISWDPETNTMYMISSNAAQTETQLYTVYWPTKELSWIGPPASAPKQIWSGAFNGNGSFFGIDNVTGAVWKVNKYSGEWTEVGPLGYGVSYYQACGFDKSNYAKMLWCGWGNINGSGLFEVDTATGAATLIGAWPGSNPVVTAVGFIPIYGPQITHIPLQNTSNLMGPYAVNASIISPGSVIASTKLYWSRNNPNITDSIIMTNISGTNWNGNIPGNGTFATYRYYIWTIDSLNRPFTAPSNAPASLYTFYTVPNDTIKPVISHTPLENINIMLWPDTVTASVTDNNGLDSVWVNWSINNTFTRHFKLLNTSGNIYSTKFNSTYGDVRVGDTIFYRIIAQDSSINHNKDSINLLSFVITAGEYQCIGNGSIQLSWPSPFNTNYKTFRTQILLTADEIYSGGGTEGFISKIGFYILNADTMAYNNFNINMQNTSLNILMNGFITDGWALAYSGKYKVPSTGWQYITLSNPFYWDGTSNLLIETCFGNSTTKSGSTIQGSNDTAKYYFGYRNDTLGCWLYPENLYGYYAKPNICFRFDPTIGLENEGNNIPSEYKLYQNFPNPFNPVTRINYDISKRGFVNLRIYDILGREVKSLVNEIKSIGSYSIDYNASGLASGIYFYRLECNGFVSTKRMLLIK